MQPNKTELQRSRNLNRLIMVKETEFEFKNLPAQKSQDQMASLVNSTKYLKKNKH